MAIEEFSRDLGYLDQFFDKLESHSSTLQGGAGPRLRTLLSEERSRWAEIRSLLAGGEVAAQPSPEMAPAGESASSGGSAGTTQAPSSSPRQAEPARPYTRAMEIGMATLPKAEPMLTEVSANPAVATRAPKSFTVGSLRRKS